jgi:hypothetical protein
MLSLIASSIILLGAIVLAVCMRMSRRARTAAVTSNRADVKNEVAVLQSLILAAQQVSERLEVNIAAARSLRPRGRDSLAALEELADPAALDDPRALDRAAAGLPPLPAGVAGDLFTADEKTLKIVRLIHQGHSVPELARRLHLPLGEVEFLVSLRPDSAR